MNMFGRALVALICLGVAACGSTESTGPQTPEKAFAAAFKLADAECDSGELTAGARHMEEATNLVYSSASAQKIYYYLSNPNSSCKGDAQQVENAYAMWRGVFRTAVVEAKTFDEVSALYDSIPDDLEHRYQANSLDKALWADRALALVDTPAHARMLYSRGMTVTQNKALFVVWDRLSLDQYASATSPAEKARACEDAPEFADEGVGEQICQNAGLAYLAVYDKAATFDAAYKAYDAGAYRAHDQINLSKLVALATTFEQLKLLDDHYICKDSALAEACARKRDEIALAAINKAKTSADIDALWPKLPETGESRTLAARRLATFYN